VANCQPTSSAYKNKKTLTAILTVRVWVKILAMTYFRMGKPHTIIGAERFHF
jgi:hypothetical protein